MREKLRVILAGKPQIRIATLKNNFGDEVSAYFAEHAEELGYYYCPECHYYIREDKYNHQADMCNACFGEEVVEEA